MPTSNHEHSDHRGAGQLAGPLHARIGFKAGEQGSWAVQRSPRWPLRSPEPPAPVSFTLDRYGHLYPDSYATLRDRLDAFHSSAQEREAEVFVLSSTVVRPQLARISTDDQFQFGIRTFLARPQRPETGTPGLGMTDATADCRCSSLGSSWRRWRRYHAG